MKIFRQNSAFKITGLTLVLLFVSGTLLAQKKKKEENTNDDYTKSDSVSDFLYEDHIYKSNIRTVQLHRSDWEQSSPIITLVSAEKLKLSFDDLDGDTKSYSYTIIHCDADWKPSDLLSSDYIQGFYDEQMYEHSSSVNTLQKFTHYNLLFPTENLQLTKSGNYMIKVYTDFDKEKFVLGRRFMVVDKKLEVTAYCKPATIIEERNYRQEIDFTLNTANFHIMNPYGDLKIVLQQNDRWDNTLTGLKPVFVKDKELDYDLGDGNVFNGGSEFRRFDTKSLHYHSEFVADVYFDSTSARYKIELLPDKKRNALRYVFEPDLNGRYKIYNQESKDYSETESDYVYIHFTLKADADKDGVFYLFGELSDWQYKPEFKMRFNSEKQVYECTAFLKQGYYNYEYVYLKDGDKVADEMPVEGTHYETENDYNILVYYRETGSNYDQLIAVKKKNSTRVN